MLDKDLAALYGVKPIRLREQVKRNKDRFPGSFMFRLNKDEMLMMVSQNAIPSVQSLGGALPYVFTEHGVLMLANILKSRQAIKVSLRLVEIFVKMREMLVENKEIMLKLEQLEKRPPVMIGTSRRSFLHSGSWCNPQIRKEEGLVSEEALKRRRMNEKCYRFT